MNMVVSRTALGQLPPGYSLERLHRATSFMRMVSQTRKIGFWKGFEPTEVGLPMPVERKARTVPDAALFARLKEIEAYAGAVNYRNASVCRCCARNRPKDPLFWNGSMEYVLRPGPNSPFVYRWPEGLMHYHDAHNIAAPEWLAELVEEFNSAYKEGHWL